MMKKSNFGWIGALLLLASAALAQQPVVTIPTPATTANNNVSGTATGSYVQIFAAAVGPNFRKGCTIINKGVNVMYVTEGSTVAASTDAAAIPVAAAASAGLAGGVYYCANPGGSTLQGQINLKGTAADIYYAAQY